MNNSIFDSKAKENFLSCLFIMALSIMLVACGGGDDEEDTEDTAQTTENGVGGTGITQGVVANITNTDLASTTTVNQIRFDTSKASFTRDGKKTLISELRLGEVISVIGVLQADKKTGIASEVIFNDTLEGPVTTESNENTIEILGQTVLVDSKTLFYGFSHLTDLKTHNIVEVSGFINKQNKILASTLRLIKTTATVDSTLQIKGHISELNKTNKTFSINNLRVDYTSAIIDETKIINGDYVLVRSLKPLENNVLIASKVLIINTKLTPNTFYKKDGYITKYDSNAKFEMSGISVTTQLNTKFINGSKENLELNKHVVTQGYTNNEGILLADEIYFISRQAQTVLEGYIEKLNDKSLIVLGTEINIDFGTQLYDERDANQMKEIAFNQFQVGEFIYSEIYQNESLTNKPYQSNYLAKIPEQRLIRVLGVVQSFDENNNIKLYSHPLIINSDTRYFDQSNKPLSKKEFFSQLESGKSLIDVVGLYNASTSSVIADTIYLSTNW